MLQRIQSIYLFFYAILAALCFWTFPSINEGMNAINEVRYIPLGLSLLVFLSIFLFTKRKIQLRLIQLVFAAHSIFAVCYVYGIGFIKMIEKIHLSSGIFFVLGLLFLGLAHRAIKKDEALIRSLDRLR